MLSPVAAVAAAVAVSLLALICCTTSALYGKCTFFLSQCHLGTFLLDYSFVGLLLFVAVAAAVAAQCYICLFLLW